MQEPSRRIVEVIRQIPSGHVLSYGEVARRAGLANGARQVARILHSSSEKQKLPWHRVVNARGQISLTGPAYLRQKRLLQAEGVIFGPRDTIDLTRHAPPRGRRRGTGH